MLAKPCTFDYWRNYKPVAPNLTVDVINSGTTEIPIKQIFQGARDPETGHSPIENVLDKVPTQRGWKLAAIKLNDPVRGTVKLNAAGNAFIYNPRSGYIGPDCFDYVLTNGTQQSDSATINLNVYQGYAYILRAYRRNSQKTYHRFTATYNNRQQSGAPAPLEPIRFTEMFWYYVQYRSETDSKGVNRIYKRRVLVQSTVADYTSYYNLLVANPTIINPGNEMTGYTYYDDTLGSGFDGDYNRPFVPTYSQGDIELEIRIYTQNRTVWSPALNRNLVQVDLNRPIILDYRLSDIYGKKWWDSGNILV